MNQIFDALKKNKADSSCHLDLLSSQVTPVYPVGQQHLNDEVMTSLTHTPLLRHGWLAQLSITVHRLQPVYRKFNIYYKTTLELILFFCFIFIRSLFASIV